MPHPLVFAASFLFLSTASFARTQIDVLTVFDQTTATVTQNFYDQTFRGAPWKDWVAAARLKISSSSSDAKLETTLNELLVRLNASHTEFVSSSDQEYWALESVFSFQVDGKPLWQIGAWFTELNGHWFVKNVFESGPAATAGLLTGDEIVLVNGKKLKPVDSFLTGKSDTFSVEIRRKAHTATQTLKITSRFESLQRSMLRASVDSYRIIDVCGKKIAYFHLWAGTNDESMEALAAAAKKAATESDEFILDLRDGFGGAYPAFLNPFFDHDDQGSPIPIFYSKPMIGLINDGVRSGKEWVADVLKKTKRATLIGTQTKGYFLAAKLFPIMKDRFDLYLAVANGPGPSDLEGNGVRPDIEVSNVIPYSIGADPQLNRALSEIQSKVCTSIK